MAEAKEKEETEENKGAQLKFYLDWALKIGLLIFGIITLFGEFGLTGNILSAYTLYLLWLHFDPVGLIFGNSKKWLNYIVLIIFYIFIIDTFVNVIKTVDIQSSEFQKIYLGIDNFLFKSVSALYSPIRQFLIGIYNSNIDVSGFSSVVGVISLLAISLYLTFALEFKSDSMAYPLVRLFKKDVKFWENIRTKSKGITKYSIVKFILAFFSLLIFSHYFFALVSQWFLVTITKSTFILAFLFAVKDIKNSGIKILDNLGGFDDGLLALIKKFFHDSKYFLTGFAILLAFHYMSDVNTFFLHYIIPAIPLEGYYLSLIGEENHLSIPALVASENITSLPERIMAIAVYFFSALGAFFILFIPIVFIFMSSTKKNIKDYLEKGRNRYILFVMLISMTLFIISPWISLRGLYQDKGGSILGIYGVDFNTNTISSHNIPILYMFFILLALILFSIIFSKKPWMQEYGITIVFLYSLVYLGLYVWYFFTSAVYYYYSLILFASSNNSMILLFLFSILLVLESLFYVGGFIYAGYRISRYIITQRTKYIVTDNSMVLWTLIFLLIPTFFLFKETMLGITIASVIIVSLFLFNFALYKEFTGAEHKDDYILSVSQVVAIFQILVITEIVLSGFIESKAILLLGVILQLVLSAFMLLFFKIKLTIKPINFKELLYILLFGALFGSLFYFVPDPFIVQVKVGIDILLFYLILIAIFEEVLFRGIVMNIAEQAFSLKRAVFLQAVVFALVHFIALNGILAYYSENGFPALLGGFYIFIYASLLFTFGIFSALIYNKSNKNIVHPIAFHFVVNLIPFIMYRIINLPFI